MFYDVYCTLCRQKGISPSRAALEMGINKGTVSIWKKGLYMPRQDTLRKIADYFNVSVDYLLGKEQQPEQKTSDLTEKERRDVARDVQKIMSNLEESGDLMFDGVPMSEAARASMAAAMRIGLEEARRRNKETYTPKKYKKG